jgi:hypothetical protein
VHHAADYPPRLNIGTWNHTTGIYASQMWIPLRNDENQVCASSAQPPRVPVSIVPQSGRLVSHEDTTRPLEATACAS